MDKLYLYIRELQNSNIKSFKNIYKLIKSMNINEILFIEVILYIIKKL